MMTTPTSSPPSEVMNNLTLKGEEADSKKRKASVTERPPKSLSAWKVVCDHEVAYLRPSALLFITKAYYWARMTKEFIVVEVDNTFKRRLLHTLHQEVASTSDLPNITVRDVIMVKRSEVKRAIFNGKNEKENIPEMGDTLVRLHLLITSLVRKRGEDTCWPKIAVQQLKFHLLTDSQEEEEEKEKEKEKEEEEKDSQGKKKKSPILRSQNVFADVLTEDEGDEEEEEDEKEEGTETHHNMV
jgi:hypothetical protein